MADDEREEQEVAPKTREGAEQAAALDRVTDNVGSVTSNICLLGILSLYFVSLAIQMSLTTYLFNPVVRREGN